MADTKSLESYNDPAEFNYIDLTLNVTGSKSRKYVCHAKTFKDTVLDMVGTEFSENVVTEYNHMVATRQKEMESADNKQFAFSDVVKKAYLYSNKNIPDIDMIIRNFEQSKNHKKGHYKIDNVNSNASSLYMDIAIASAMNMGTEEIKGAFVAARRCEGIARTNAEYDKAFIGSDTGYIPAEKTIQYFDDIYHKSGIGSVKVDLANKNDLNNYLQSAGIHLGSRVICEVEEPKHDSAVVYAVKKKSNEGYDFFRIKNGNSIPLDPSKPEHQSIIAKAQEAIENKRLKVWDKGRPSDQALAIDKLGSTTVEYDYILKETREYMYTGTNSKTGEPTFSRLTNNGGDLNVPVSQLPITKTKAVIDHTKLCLAKVEKELDNSPTLNPNIVKNFIPNVAFDYNLPKDKALGWSDVNNMKLQAKLAFENTYNPSNAEIQGMLLAKNMKKDHDRAIDLADDRSNASKEVQEVKETKEIPVLANENQDSFVKDPALAVNEAKNKNDPTKGILAIVQRNKGGRS